MAPTLRIAESKEKINLSQNVDSDDIYGVSPEHAALKSSARDANNATTSNASKTSVMPEPSKTSTGKLKKPGAVEALRAKAAAATPASASKNSTSIFDIGKSPGESTKKTKAQQPVAALTQSKKDAAPASKPQPAPAAKSAPKPKAAKAAKSAQVEPKNKPAQGTKNAPKDSDEYKPGPSKKQTRAQAAADKKRAAAIPSVKEPAPARAKAPSKQVNSVIELSDNDESSSLSEAPENPAKETGATTRPPETPEAMPSSPPQPETRKTTVIAFDRSGPRNQGLKKPPGSAAPNSRKNGMARRPGASSVATSVRTSMAARPAAPSNVADNFDDALRAFSAKKRPIPAQSTTLKASTLSHVETPKATLFPSQKQSKLSTFEEPEMVEQEDEGFVNLNEEEDEREHIPEPAQKRIKPSTQKLPDVVQPAPETVEDHSRPEHADGESTNMDVDQQSEQAPEPAVNPVSERVKRMARLKPNMNEPVLQPGQLREVDAKSHHFERPQASGSQRLEQVVDKPGNSHPKKRKLSAAFAATERETEAGKMGRQTRSRQVSQASQTVDINGSPVPRDMDVGEDATVLDTYSQRAPPSSEQAQPLPTPDFTRNKKTQPASPRAESKVIPGVTLNHDSSPSAEILTGNLSTRADDLRGYAPSKRDQALQYSRGNDDDLLEDANNAEDEDGEWGDDPDKTLVDGEESFLPTGDIKNPSNTLPKEAEYEFQPFSDDLMAWCNTLKPHQLDFFDELVKVVHNVVDFAAQQENSQLRMLESQHKQGLRRIEKEELDCAKKHADLTAKLQRARRERKRKLRAAEENIKTAIANHEAEVQEREAKFLTRQETNRSIERILAKHE